jgi:glucose-6-phosphate isomerase
LYFEKELTTVLVMLYTQKTLNVGLKDGLSLEKARKAVKDIKSKMQTDGDYDALSIAYKDSDLREIIDFSDFINKNFKKVLVFGIGGSSLGAKTLLSLKHQDKVQILENIDSHSVEFVFSNLDLENTAFLTISKSGKTIECISQTLILLKIVEDKLGRDAICKHFFFLTENKDSPLTQLSKEFGIKTLEHHKTIGGRFSYLSNVGLIPACIAGLDIKEIRRGAADTLDYIFENEDNFISDICAKQSELYSGGVVASVVMSYIERLEKLTEWYRQLWAESLGKCGYGTIPVDAIGTIDQHSQLQLYMDGPKNLFFTFITKEKDESALKIRKSYNREFDYLLNMSLDDIMNIEAISTIEVLNKRNLPIRVFKIEKLNERCLSQLMMQYMLETIIIGKINGVNPFGQSSVEERKKLAHEMFRDVKLR